MLSIPNLIRWSLTDCLTARARECWPQIYNLAVRFRNPYAYVDADLTGGDSIKLCRLRYTGDVNVWGFSIWRASHDDYRESSLPTGRTSGTPEDALDTACWFLLYEPPPTMNQCLYPLPPKSTTFLA